MKYTIKRIFSLKNKKFEIISDSKTFCTAKTTHSNEYKGRYNIKLSNPINKYIGEDNCIVEPDPNQLRGYLIYFKNDNKTKILFGQLIYEFCDHNNYLYTIIIGQKLYQIRSSDLKNRRLTITDTIKSRNSSKFDYPMILFQVNDLFSQSNKIHHVTINDKKCQYGYLALIILLDLYECKRNIF